MDKEHKNENYGDFKMTDDSRAGSTQKHPKSILSFQKPHPSIAKHRTEKSIECLEWLIKTFTNEGEVVLDNAAGSGTTAIASINTKRNYIAIEKDKFYYNMVNDRIKELKKITETIQE